MTTLADISVVSQGQGEAYPGGPVYDYYVDSTGHTWIDYTGSGQLSAVIDMTGQGGGGGSPYMPGTGVDQLTAPQPNGQQINDGSGTRQAGVSSFLPGLGYFGTPGSSNAWLWILAGILLLTAVAVRKRGQ